MDFRGSSPPLLEHISGADTIDTFTWLVCRNCIGNGTGYAYAICVPVCGIGRVANDNHYQQLGMVIAWPYDDNDNHSHLDSYCNCEAFATAPASCNRESFASRPALQLIIILNARQFHLSRTMEMIMVRK